MTFSEWKGDTSAIIGAARSYRFWGPLGTIWDLRGPSGDHHSKKLSILVIFNQHMSLLTQNAFSKFQNVIFHQDFSPKAAAAQQKSLKAHFQNLDCHFPPGFFAEGRRGLAKKLFNSNIGINMGINMGFPINSSYFY